jgi:crotonobetainyl-CoA:carnitine CoA-transferase CaiB-like acyl-CoA transferase
LPKIERRRERALGGVRVLELAGFLAGPYCGQILADLGADVLKVEAPAKGDPSRDLPDRLGAQSVLFAMCNRNKRSVAIDLANPEGREAFYRLARTADVLLDGHRPGELDRLGAGYEAVALQAPRLVYCSLSGYGQDGPYSQRVGRDGNFAALVGLVDQNGSRGGPPAFLPAPVVEQSGGLFAAVSILAALRARERSGHGQHVDLSLVEAAAALMALPYGHYWATHQAPLRGTGTFTGGCPGYAVYPTRDGRFLALGALEDRYWCRLCDLAGRPDLAERRCPEDPTERAATEGELALVIAQRSLQEWVDLLADDEVCAAPVLALDEALRDPHLVHRGTFDGIPLEDGGRLPQVGFPAHLPATPVQMTMPPPRLGEHTEQVLAELGYAPEAVRRLIEAGAVSGWPL